MIRRPPRSTLRPIRRQRQMCIRDSLSTPDFGKSLYTDHPKVHQYLKALNAASFGQNQQIITVGEMSSTTIANAIKYTDPAEKELDMVFNFHHLKVDYLNGQKWFNQPWD